MLIFVRLMRRGAIGIEAAQCVFLVARIAQAISLLAEHGSMVGLRRQIVNTKVGDKRICSRHRRLPCSK